MKTITVCNKCLQASCWQGIFMCQEAQNAGTVEKTREELEELDLENPCYWDGQEFEKDGPTDHQLALSQAGHEASEARYRDAMQQAGRGRLLP